tara:strand:- start:1826 stop:2098 length:273 start_codon:yes stop_codon:yes gene_type:complete
MSRMKELAMMMDESVNALQSSFNRDMDMALMIRTACSLLDKIDQRDAEIERLKDLCKANGISHINDGATRILPKKMPEPALPEFSRSDLW